MKLIICCSTLLLLLLLPRGSQGGNILVIPMDGSHWINMDIMLQALHSRGHNLTIMRTSKSWYIKANSSYYHSYTLPVERATDEKLIKKLVSDLLEFERGALPLTSVLLSNFGLFAAFYDAHSVAIGAFSAMMNDKELMRTLNESKFDLVLTDPFWGGGVILAKYLNLPMVYNVRWIMPEDAHLAIAPSPISYIPMTGSGNTDKMTFFQRIKNMILYLSIKIQSNILARIYQPLCDKYLGPGHDFYEMKIDADIWLMRNDFVFDFPRPTMPNVVYIGGFQCKPAKPLPEHLEEFVQSSGDHGFIIMSLGTFVDELPDNLIDYMAAAFAELPQKVIWKYKGSTPSTLGNNTLMVHWMPQNDLLGHPKIKLFVAHGGTNGIQEALYHGVPVVGLPLFFDQYDNLLRLEARGGAKILSIATVDKDENFLKAIKEVVNEPSYRMNMQTLSKLHRDQPMTPMENALFWIEFAIRHKGAAHLKAESNRLPWYSYHSVDVFLFLTGAVLLMLLTTVIFIRCSCRAVWKKKVKHD